MTHQTPPWSHRSNHGAGASATLGPVDPGLSIPSNLVGFMESFDLQDVADICSLTGCFIPIRRHLLDHSCSRVSARVKASQKSHLLPFVLAASSMQPKDVSLLLLIRWIS